MGGSWGCVCLLEARVVTTKSSILRYLHPATGAWYALSTNKQIMEGYTIHKPGNSTKAAILRMGDAQTKNALRKVLEEFGLGNTNEKVKCVHCGCIFSYPYTAMNADGKVACPTCRTLNSVTDEVAIAYSVNYKRIISSRN